MKNKMFILLTFILGSINFITITSGDNIKNFQYNIPGINQPFELAIPTNLDLTKTNILIETIINTPSSFQPFKNDPTLNAIPFINAINLSKIKLRAKSEIIQLIKNKQTLPAEYMIEIVGEVNMFNKPLNCTLTIKFEKNTLKNIIASIILPNDSNLINLSPELTNTTAAKLKFKNLGIIICLNDCTEKFTDLNINIPDFKAPFPKGASLIGIIESFDPNTLIQNLPKELDGLKNTPAILLKKNFNLTAQNKPIANNSTFEVYGASKIKGIQALSCFYYETTKTQKKYFFKYKGLTNAKSINPYDDIEELTTLKYLIPENLKNIKADTVEFNLVLYAKEKVIYYTIQTRLFGIQQTLSFFPVKTEEGKSGLVIQSMFNKEKISLAEMFNILKNAIMQETPAFTAAIFDQFLKNIIFTSTICSSSGFIFSSLPYMFNVSREYGITTFKTNDGLPLALDKGLTPYGRMLMEGEIKVNKVFGTDNLISDIGKELFFIGNIKPMNLSLIHLITEGRLKFDFPFIKIAPSLLKTEISLKFGLTAITPTVAAIVGVNIQPEKNKPPLFFSGRLQVFPTDMIIRTALTMQGVWENPFGFEYLTFYNMAGQLDWDFTAKTTAATGTEAVATAASAGAATGKGGGAASGTATPAHLVGVGFTFDVEVGKKNDPLKKEIKCGFNIIKKITNLLLSIKLLGTLGKKDLNRTTDLLINLSSIIQTSFNAFNQQIQLNEMPAKNISKNVPAKEQSFLELLLNTPLPSKTVSLSINQAMNDIQTFANKSKAQGDSLGKWIKTLPEMTLIDPEFKFGFNNIAIGEIVYPRGIKIYGILDTLGAKSGVNIKINTDGIICESFIPKLDLGALISNEFKNQIIIDGAGIDGKYGTKDDGPAETIKLTFKEQGAILTGKVNIKPLNSFIETEVRILKDEFSCKGIYKPYGPTYEIELDIHGEITDNNPDILIKGTFKSDLLKELNNQIEAHLKELNKNNPQPFKPNQNLFSVNSATIEHSVSQAIQGNNPKIIVQGTVLGEPRTFTIESNIKDLKYYSTNIASQIYKTLNSAGQNPSLTPPPIQPSQTTELKKTEENNTRAINNFNAVNKPINDRLSGIIEAAAKKQLRIEIMVEK
ncbi:MAG: hypothetical protein UR26_C0006G0043 [candidate division TM6 bacterium GW2011_GWF2_32_72]|nr:MAG: hypothetical protein UR26_C0006G0043 [candidate division TM6 bacterium GW2011_GWF2_32_72]